MHQDKRSDLAALARPIARRVNLAVWMNYSMGGVLGALGVFATVLISLKLLYPPGAQYAVVLLALAPTAMLWAYARCRRLGLFFSSAEIIEVIDHLYRNDGSISAYAEAPQLAPGADFYREVVAEVSSRLPRLDPGHYVKKLAPVALFALVAVAVPPRPSAASMASKEVLAKVSQPLLEKLAEYQEILPEEELQELNEELDKINKSPRGISKEQWEAIEELEDRINEAAKRSESNMSDLASKLSDLSNQMNASGSASTDSQLDPKAQDLLADIEKMMKDPNTSISGAIKKDMASLAGKPGASPAGLKKMLEELRKELAKKPGGT